VKTEILFFCLCRAGRSLRLLPRDCHACCARSQWQKIAM